MQPRSKALAYKYAVENGFANVNEIITWVEKIIADEDKPPIWAIEISLSSSENLIDALENVTGKDNTNEIWYCLKKIIKNAVENQVLKPSFAIGHLNALMQDSLVPKIEHGDILYFIMNWDSVEEGAIEEKPMVDELMIYLNKE